MASRSDPLTITSYGDGIGFRRLAVGGVCSDLRLLMPVPYLRLLGTILLAFGQSWAVARCSEARIMRAVQSAMVRMRSSRQFLMA